MVYIMGVALSDTYPAKVRIQRFYTFVSRFSQRIQTRFLEANLDLFLITLDCADGHLRCRTNASKTNLCSTSNP
jgi:hypothetical protein